MGLRQPKSDHGIPAVITCPAGAGPHPGPRQPLDGGSSAVHLDHLKEKAMRLSARNQIPATGTGSTAGEAIANVELDANGVRLVASITVEACRDLGLAQGTRVTALIKASEVILATDD
jgi:molybdopterin-binding protein